MEIKDYIKQFRDLQKSHKKVRVADFCRENMLDYYEMVEALKQDKFESESYESQVQCGDLVITEIPDSNEATQPKPSTEGYIKEVMLSFPKGLKLTVVELPLVGQRYRMQTVRHREYDMEIPGRDDLFPAELNPLLTLLLLALGAMPVTAAVVADSDVPSFGTHLDMPVQGTGTALRHVPEGSFNRRDYMMLAKELSTVAPDNLTDVEARPHRLGGNMVSISRTCFIGSMFAI